LSAPETAVDPTRWVVIGDDSGHIYGPYPQAEARTKADEWSRLGFDDHFHVVLWDEDVLGSPNDALRRQHGWGILHQTKDDLYAGGLIEVEAKRTAATWNQNTGFRYFKAGKIEGAGDGADDFLVERPSANGQTNEN
jgi:hypothetical protein